MRSVVIVILCFWTAGTWAQYPGGSPPWGQGGSGGQGPSRPSYGKPSRPSPYGGSTPYGKPSSSSSSQINYDDPIPANPSFDSSYDAQQLPSKLPILAPNGVVEIYNRVVDDLIKRLDADFKKKEIDPMQVVIRPTPAGPVRVPGHLQKRPFRRPGAALYRSNVPNLSVMPARTKKARDLELDVPELTFPEITEEKPSFRGAGKISKGPLGEEKVEVTETTPASVPVPVPSVVAVENTPVPVVEAVVPEVTPAAPVPVPVSNKSDEVSSEENFFRDRSEEYFSDDDIEVDLDDKDDIKEVTRDKKEKKNKKEEEEEVGDEEEEIKDKAEGKKDVETLIQRYQNKNVNENTNKGKGKYSAAGSKKKDETTGGTGKDGKKQKPVLAEDPEEPIEEEDDDDDDEIHDDLEEIEPGTLQSAGNRPNGGYYPPGGPPAVPTKPNAKLTGLSKIRRASDVAVSVDARSAVITARLLVGPLDVIINDSSEPMEKNVRATIPELEAELILMERHGVVFLQRFTLDRAYGQDVEISIPKAKSDKKKKGTKGGNNPIYQGPGGPGGLDPNHPMHAGAQQRYQTKMAAHISMEVVKLLRSGNLRVNIMRTAQSSMSKLKLPIKSKTSKKKNKKSEKKDE